MEIVSDNKRVRIALNEFNDVVKHTLILHEGTEYFVGRIPAWQGALIEYDAFGQRVNGVIKIDHTSDSQYPVWSPIDIQHYEAYMKGLEDRDTGDFLAGQIVELLHTIRKNYLYSTMKFDDANDLKVVQNGLPMLEVIVTSFLR